MSSHLFPYYQTHCFASIFYFSFFWGFIIAKSALTNIIIAFEITGFSLILIGGRLWCCSQPKGSFIGYHNRDAMLNLHSHLIIAYHFIGVIFSFKACCYRLSVGLKHWRFWSFICDGLILSPLIQLPSDQEIVQEAFQHLYGFDIFCSKKKKNLSFNFSSFSIIKFIFYVKSLVVNERVNILFNFVDVAYTPLLHDYYISI